MASNRYRARDRSVGQGRPLNGDIQRPRFRHRFAPATTAPNNNQTARLEGSGIRFGSWLSTSPQLSEFAVNNDADCALPSKPNTSLTFTPRLLSNSALADSNRWLRVKAVSPHETLIGVSSGSSTTALTTSLTDRVGEPPVNASRLSSILSEGAGALWTFNVASAYEWMVPASSPEKTDENVTKTEAGQCREPPDRR